MAKNTNSTKSLTQQLLDQIDVISGHYEKQFAQTDDIKALQGMERCVELRMKICGLDGKQSIESLRAPEPTLSLAELPLDLLQNIINHIKTLPMQQQQ